MKIVRLVRDQEMPSGEIARHFRTTSQAISQHLRILKSAGLIELRRAGTKRLYKVRRRAFGELRNFLEMFEDEAGADQSLRSPVVLESVLAVPHAPPQATQQSNPGRALRLNMNAKLEAIREAPWQAQDSYAPEVGEVLSPVKPSAIQAARIMDAIQRIMSEPAVDPITGEVSSGGTDRDRSSSDLSGDDLKAFMTSDITLNFGTLPRNR